MVPKQLPRLDPQFQSFQIPHTPERIDVIMPEICIVSQLQDHGLDRLKLRFFQIIDYSIGKCDGVSFKSDVDARWTELGLEVWLVDGESFRSRLSVDIHEGRGRSGGSEGLDVAWPNTFVTFDLNHTVDVIQREEPNLKTELGGELGEDMEAGVCVHYDVATTSLIS